MRKNNRNARTNAQNELPNGGSGFDSREMAVLLYRLLTEMATLAHKLLFDKKSAATTLSISVRTLDYLISDRQLATKRIGGKVLIHRDELHRFARGNHFFIEKGAKS